MKEQVFTIDGRPCHVFGTDAASDCILCGMEHHAPEEIADTAELFYKSAAAYNFRLVIFETNDWNGDFSPWPSAPAFGTEPFTGKAPDTLRWLSEALLPQLTTQGILSADSRKYLAGYSLSGLFALWAFLESDLFDGAASCSGSLWLPGWLEYLKKCEFNHDGIVYLSLGTKEEKTRNARMSAVGDNTRETADFLKQNPQIRKITLEWNNGGHFTEPVQRLVKGMLWLAIPH